MNNLMALSCWLSESLVNVGKRALLSHENVSFAMNKQFAYDDDDDDDDDDGSDI
jgi:hypothetical protein